MPKNGVGQEAIGDGRCPRCIRLEIAKILLLLNRWYQCHLCSSIWTIMNLGILDTNLKIYVNTWFFKVICVGYIPEYHRNVAVLARASI